MSIRLMSIVWDVPLADSEKLILLALADWANDDGECWPSIAQLARKSSKSERTVQGTIQRLKDGGHLTRVEVPGRGCRYVIHPRKDCTPADAAPRSDCTPAENAPAQRATVTPAAAAPNTSRTTKSSEANASSEARATKKPEKVKLEVPDWMPTDAWSAFVEMRRAMPKIPFTVRAAKEIISDLDGFRRAGHDIAAILMKSVKNGYRGVFAPDVPASTPLKVTSQSDRETGDALRALHKAYENQELDFDTYMDRKNALLNPPRRAA